MLQSKLLLDMMSSCSVACRSEPVTSPLTGKWELPDRAYLSQYPTRFIGLRPNTLRKPNFYTFTSIHAAVNPGYDNMNYYYSM